jgi:hypothetical protein
MAAGVLVVIGCTDGPYPDQMCMVFEQGQCQATPSCMVLDCAGCAGMAPDPMCVAVSTMSEPCGMACKEACSSYNEQQCAATAGCGPAMCPDASGTLKFAGCHVEGSSAQTTCP